MNNSMPELTKQITGLQHFVPWQIEPFPFGPWFDALKCSMLMANLYWSCNTPNALWFLLTYMLSDGVMDTLLFTHVRRTSWRVRISNAWLSMFCTVSTFNEPKRYLNIIIIWQWSEVQCQMGMPDIHNFSKYMFLKVLNKGYIQICVNNLVAHCVVIWALPLCKSVLSNFLLCGCSGIPRRYTSTKCIPFKMPFPLFLHNRNCCFSALLWSFFRQAFKLSNTSSSRCAHKMRSKTWPLFQFFQLFIIFNDEWVIFMLENSC